MDISIIIVNWNTRSILRDCLRSVFSDVQKPDFETIVVDNASDDGSPQMVESEFPQVTLIRNSENRGFAAANNQGMRIARGRYFLLLNSDTLLIDEVLRKTVDFADAHPEVAVTGCRVLNQDGSLQPTCFMFPSAMNMLLWATYLYKVMPGNRFFGRERMTWWDRSDERQVDVVTGCFMLVRREAVEQVGMMDERFFMYAEETDWCYRFRQAGWKMAFTPEGLIVHLGGQSTCMRSKEMLLQLLGSTLLFLKKHRTRAEYVCACLLMSAFFAVRIPVLAVRGALSPHSRGVVWQRCRVYCVGAIRSLRGAEALCGSVE